MPGILPQPDIPGDASPAPVGPVPSRPVRSSPVRSGAVTIRAATTGQPSGGADGIAGRTLTGMSRHRAALSTLLVIVALVVSVAPVAAATPSASAINAAEKYALDRANVQRAQRGLVPLRWDQRVADIARERSAYMAATGRFSHAHSGGSDAFDLLTRDDIRWYGAAEIIAWNTTNDANASAASAVSQWMGSTGHRAILLSSNLNYIGFGLAVGPDGKRYWTGVAIKGPDRSPPRAVIRSVTEQVVDSRTMRIIVRWAGSDLPLQVLTSGLRYYETQRRVDGGPWQTYGTTTNTYASRWFTRGVPAEFRVRSRDRAGLWSPWRTVTLTP